MREIVGMTKRNLITEMHHPDRLSVEEFIELVSDRQGQANFIANMRNSKLGPMYAEDWADIYVRWMEFNK